VERQATAHKGSHRPPGLISSPEKALQQVDAFRPAEVRALRHGEFKLPDEVMRTVFYHLAASLEPGGIRGVSLVMQDMASAAQVRKGGP
jgi:hypothetical protein